MMPDDNFLNERLAKAAEYFKPLTADLREWCLKLSESEIDNKEVRKKVKEACDETMICLDIKYRSLELILSCGFRSENYNRIKTDCLLEDRTKTRKRRLKKLERTDNELGTVNEQLRKDCRNGAWNVSRPTTYRLIRSCTRALLWISRLLFQRRRKNCWQSKGSVKPSIRNTERTSCG